MLGWPMNIRSAKVEQLAQRLARLTGEDVETALQRAIEERLSRVAPPAPADRKTAMDAFFARVSRLRVLDARPADEIVGYDGCGLPS
jgi:antitoxin VapB